jgi:hypothetical protein
MNTATLAPEHRRTYLLGGHAKVTLKSLVSGKSFTYRIVAGSDRQGNQSIHFVSVLSGPDNQADYQFIGTIFDKKVFRHGTRSLVPRDSPSVRAFAWLWDRCETQSNQFELWHSGHCCRCGRELTTVESIASGIGPVCATKD